MTPNNILRLKSLGLFIISPIYVPLVVCWENRQDIKDFYKECWQVATNTHEELEKKQDAVKK
tara:strand:- start:17 stop:202 length:186 start_codon:yes stop_codon:yes gene_type:complete